MALGFPSLPITRRVAVLPARDLGAATRACDPYAPLDAVADESLHVDFDRWRGGPRLHRITRNIRRAESSLSFLSGHMGTGKTTELRRLARDLERADGSAEPPVRVIYVDAEALLDQTDIEVEDLLLAIWSELLTCGEAVSEPLSVLWNHLSLARSPLGDLGIPAAVGEGVSRLLGLVKLSPPEQKRLVRNALASNTQSVVRGLNEAIERLRGGAVNVAVFIDNLEKLALSERDVVEHLYLNRLGILRQLAVHMVITVPLYLVYSSAGGGLSGRWGGETVILPMVKVRNRRRADGSGGEAFPEGLQAMVDMIERRVDFVELFETGHSAAQEIARLSGGCPRHALRLVSLALNEHDHPKVSNESVSRAADAMAADFDRALEERFLKVLLHVVRTSEFPDECEPEIKRALLRNLFVLEYQNADPHPWHAVHPLVERVRRFQSAQLRTGAF